MSERKPGVLAVAPPQLAERIEAYGGRRFHAASLRRWILARGARDWDRLTDLPKPLRAAMEEQWSLLETEVAEERRASDGTVKLLLSLHDGETVETVWMPQPESAATVCISTQVGCPMACAFCASGLAGIVRNLSAHEILEQVVRAAHLGPVGRVVVMGIGEPTLNLDAVLEALAAVTSPDGMGLSARKVTISTVGLPDRIRELARCDRPYTLAISLHAPDDELRHRLIPTVKKISFDDVLAAARDYFDASGREVTFEYVLLGGVNDRAAQAHALATKLRGVRGGVNLIPFNPVDASGFRRPEERDVYTFRDTLRSAGITATVRWSRGLDADAACGQLRIHASRPSGGTPAAASPPAAE